MRRRPVSPAHGHAEEWREQLREAVQLSSTSPHGDLAIVLHVAREVDRGHPASADLAAAASARRSTAAIAP